LIENQGIIFIAIFIAFSVFSYIIFRKIGKNLIKKYLKTIRKNDCLGFNEEIIGKKKYFIRERFVRRDRQTNMNHFEHAVDDAPKKKLLNQIGDIYNEEGKIIIIILII
jgi:hypothetical protein